MYQFKLQPVLDHRKFLEDDLKKRLAEIKTKLLSALERLDAMKRKEMITNQTLAEEQANGLSSAQVVAYHQYLKVLSERIVEQAREAEKIEAQVSTVQKEMIEAVKKRKILEKLKEQGLERYRKSMLAQETKFIDEIAINQFVRKTIE